MAFIWRIANARHSIKHTKTTVRSTAADLDHTASKNLATLGNAPVFLEIVPWQNLFMLTGKKFKLERATLAVTMVEGRRRAVAIPLGAIIEVVSGPTPGDRMVDVLWDGKTLEMFAVDVDVRGTEIVEPGHSGDFIARANVRGG